MTPNASDSLILTITSKLARERGVDVLDLPPLQEYVDTDALGKLLNGHQSGQASQTVRVTFPVDSHTVQVDADGTVIVQSRESTEQVDPDD